MPVRFSGAASIFRLPTSGRIEVRLPGRIQLIHDRAFLGLPEQLPFGGSGLKGPESFGALLPFLRCQLPGHRMGLYVA